MDGWTNVRDKILWNKCSDFYLLYVCYFFRDEETQHVGLQIIYGMLRNMKPDEVLYVLPSVSSFTTNSSATCRKTMYDIFMWLYDNYR